MNPIIAYSRENATKPKIAPANSAPKNDSKITLSSGLAGGTSDWPLNFSKYFIYKILSDSSKISKIPFIS